MPGGPEAVDHRETEDGEKREERPAPPRDGGARGVAEPERAQKHGQRHGRGEGHDEAEDEEQRERQRHEVEPDEAAALLLAIGDVHPLNECLHPLRRAPQRQEDTQGRADSDAGARAFGNLPRLRAQDLGGVLGQRAGHGLKLARDVRRVEDEARDGD
jgi:hypothetical protein